MARDGFNKNVEVNAELNNYVKKIIYNPYTGTLLDVESLNLLNRKELAKNFCNTYFVNDNYTEIGGQEKYDEFIKYIARKIDKLIPRFYFLENHKDLSLKYSSLFTTRIFTTFGKNGFEETEHFIYCYKHNFDKELEHIKKTAATIAQIDLLDKLADEQGYQLINFEYLTKVQANSLIKYFTGESDAEPVIFNFFIIAI